MDVHGAVKAILMARGKTQKQLSEELGYSQSTVLNNILTGGNPRLKTLLRICKCLDCELAILYKDWEYTLTEDEK